MIKLKDILSEIKVSLPFKRNTAGWWFSKFPEPYRTQAIKNWKNHKVYKINPNGPLFDNIVAALSGAFVWEDTPEGVIYWIRFVSELEEKSLREIKVVNPNHKNFPIIKQYIDEIKINVGNLPKSPITISNHKEFLKLMELLLKNNITYFKWSNGYIDVDFGTKQKLKYPSLSKDYIYPLDIEYNKNEKYWNFKQ